MRSNSYLDYFPWRNELVHWLFNLIRIPSIRIIYIYIYTCIFNSYDDWGPCVSSCSRCFPDLYWFNFDAFCIRSPIAKTSLHSTAVPCLSFLNWYTTNVQRPSRRCVETFQLYTVACLLSCFPQRYLSSVHVLYVACIAIVVLLSGTAAARGCRSMQSDQASIRKLYKSAKR